MLRPRSSGSIVCPSCGRLVGVRDAQCLGCGRRNPGMWGWAPVLSRLGSDLGVTPLVIGGCVALYLAMLLVGVAPLDFRHPLGLLSPTTRSAFLFGASGYEPVLRLGRWWTVLSAGWLHGGLLHILFNMMWIRQLLPPVVRLWGPGRALTIYTASSAAGFAMSTAAAFFPRFLTGILGLGPFTLGSSASLFGLLGALVFFGRRTGQRAAEQQVWGWVIAFFVFGLIMPGIDNWAHLGGFLGGWVVARLLDPMQPERPRDLLVGLGGLAASALAIAFSLIHGYALLSG